MDYTEKEIKILNVDTDTLIEKIRALGAKEVFNADRIITHFDNEQNAFRDRNFKLTEEDKLKLSISTFVGENKETVKLFVSQKEECVELLKRIDIRPIAEVKSHRISFEWEGIDFDIDQFPRIPAFLEIDFGESNYSLEDVLKKLGLENCEKVEMSTPEIYEKYNLDYFELFKIKSLP